MMLGPDGPGGLDEGVGTGEEDSEDDGVGVADGVWAMAPAALTSRSINATAIEIPRSLLALDLALR